MTRRLALYVVASLAFALVLGACAQRGADSAASPEVTNPDKEVTLQTPIQFADSAHVRTAVETECQLSSKLERFIEEFGAEYQIKVANSTKAVDEIPGEVVQVRITDVHAPGGGAFSGAKSVTIAGELTENGTQTGSFEARRVSGGGAFAAFKGTCSILGRDVETLGKDVAKFLTSPVEGARLGNM